MTYLLLILSFIYTGITFASDQSVLEKINSLNTQLDLNSDGKTDCWRTFENGDLKKAIFDGDFNGKQDTWVDYSDEQIVRSEDSNGDGKIDLKSIQHFSRNINGEKVMIKAIHQMVSESEGKEVLTLLKEIEFDSKTKKSKITKYEQGKVVSISYQGIMDAK